MARRSAIEHPNSENNGGLALQSGKISSSESSASEKAEDNGERQIAFSRYPKSSDAQLGFSQIVDDAVVDYDSSYDQSCSSSFEFQKGERGFVRPSLAPFLNKVAPSKWDDAEKWLVSPTLGDAVPIRAKAKSGPLHGHYASGGFLTGIKGITSNLQDWHANSLDTKIGHRTPYASDHRGGDNSVVIDVDGHPENTKLVTMVHTDQHYYQMEGWIKDTDSSTGSGSVPPFAFAPSPSSFIRGNSFENHALADVILCLKEVGIHEEQDGTLPKPMPRTQKPVSDALVSVAPLNSPAPAVRSISMRDMGTEMTPIASQEPSRTGTPIRATTPTLRSPMSSCPSSPRQGSSMPSPAATLGNLPAAKNDTKKVELGGKFMQVEARREVQISAIHVGGKLSIVPWASKDEEDADASKLLKTIDLEEVKKNVLETRAAAWEEAEKSKYMARFKREETKILAWENHQKVKAEAELRQMEVKMEKVRMRAQEKLLNKLTKARQKAEECLAAAEAKRCEQVVKASHQADYIRHTGRLPSSIFNWNLCL